MQIIPISCSGVDKSTEYLMRCMALATNGTYTFVTDHSGIGNSHIEPSTDVYKVEYLNDVITRLIVSRSRTTPCEKEMALKRPIDYIYVKPTKWQAYQPYARYFSHQDVRRDGSCGYISARYSG
ncbi:MAG: hypothetical protein R2795_14880 [Saprospiraceae bacterium]